jgi:hypothetical protein
MAFNKAIFLYLSMSKKYKFADNDKFYFVSFAVTNGIDLFIMSFRNYKAGHFNCMKYSIAQLRCTQSYAAYLRQGGPFPTNFHY